MEKLSHWCEKSGNFAYQIRANPVDTDDVHVMLVSVHVIHYYSSIFPTVTVIVSLFRCHGLTSSLPLLFRYHGISSLAYRYSLDIMVYHL